MTYSDPPFQIDGNFGTLGGITRMLLQSELNRDGTVTVYFYQPFHPYGGVDQFEDCGPGEISRLLLAGKKVVSNG